MRASCCGRSAPTSSRWHCWRNCRARASSRAPSTPSVRQASGSGCGCITGGAPTPWTARDSRTEPAFPTIAVSSWTLSTAASVTTCSRPPRVRSSARPVYVGDRPAVPLAVASRCTFLQPHYDRVATLARILVLGTLLGALLAMVVGAAIAQVALAPMATITRTAGQINRAQDLGRRIPATGNNDELGRLTVTINDMLDRIQAMFERQRQLVADMSASCARLHHHPGRDGPHGPRRRAGPGGPGGSAQRGRPHQPHGGRLAAPGPGQQRAGDRALPAGSGAGARRVPPGRQPGRETGVQVGEVGPDGPGATPIGCGSYC